MKFGDVYEQTVRLKDINFIQVTNEDKKKFDELRKERSEAQKFHEILEAYQTIGIPKIGTISKDGINVQPPVQSDNVD